MKKGKLKNFLEKTKQFSVKKYIPHRPETIWIIVLILFSVLIMLVFAWSILTFLDLGKGGNISASTNDTADPESINRAELDKLLDVLIEKENVFKKLTDTTVQVLDEDTESIEETTDGEETDGIEEVNPEENASSTEE